MAAIKLLLSQARRHSLSKPPYLVSSSFLQFPKSLSSESNPNPNPNPPPPIEPPKRASQSSPIQPVSYPAKPKDQQSDSNEEPQQKLQLSPPPPPPATRTRDPGTQEARTSWTREDIRYMKDVPSITPVSYPTRVATLPEDRASASGEEGMEKEGKGVGENEEMERERRRIEAESRARRRVFRVVEEEEKVVPFPSLIKVEKKESKPVLDLKEAIRQVKAHATRNFDETLEAHVRLGIASGRTDLIVRGTVSLPHGAGKVVRVAFFAEGADADEARAAGADIVGGAELVEEIAKSGGKLNFDMCFTTPQFMPRLVKISKFLNRRGMMPKPNLGTVTSNISVSVKELKEAKRGIVEFKMDKSSIVHIGLGKMSLTEEYLRENIGAFVNSLLLAKPAGLKKTSKFAGYVNSFHICSTMGPGFFISIQSLSKAADHYNKMVPK